MPMPFNPRGGFIPPDVSRGGGVSGPVRRELPAPPLGGLNIPRSGVGVPPAGPYGGIMGGQGLPPQNGGMETRPLPMGGMPAPAPISSPTPPMNSTQPPMMRSGGVGGVAPRPAQETPMRRMRGRGGMSMF